MRNFLWCYYRLLITSVALECNIYKVLVHWELKLLNFLVDSVLISFLLKLVLPCYENKSKTRTPYVNLILIPQKNSTFRTEPNPNKSTAWTAVSNPIYNEVRVVPNEFKSNPVNPTHELGFLKPKHKSAMNSVFESSKSTSEIQEENLPTVLSSISKASKLTKLTKYQISKHVVSW